MVRTFRCCRCLDLRKIYYSLMVVRDAAEPVHDAILLFYLYCTSRISIFEAVNFSGRALLAIHTGAAAASYGRFRHSSKNVVSRCC